MARTEMSRSLKKQTSEVINQSTPTPYVITANLKSQSDPNWNVRIQFFHRLDIVEHFIGMVATYIECEFELSPKEYVESTDRYEDLMISLQFKRIDPLTFIPVKPPDIKHYKYRVLYKNKLDLNKTQSKGDIEPTNTQPQTEEHLSNRIRVEAQLIEEDFYYIRKRQTNSILTNSTVKDAIKFLTNTFGIKKLNLIEPDNKQVYQNLVLPPMMELTNCFYYLHDRFGIYEKGCTYYLKGDTLYIYPSFDVDFKDPIRNEDTFHFYNVPVNSYIGVDSYHCIKNNEYHAIIDTPVLHGSIGEETLENQGNLYVIQNMDKLLDYRTVQEGRKFSIPVDNTTHVYSPTIAKMGETAVKSSFQRSNANIFVRLTDLAASNIETAAFNWRYGEAFSIKPGQKILWHFDGAKGYEVKNGLCQFISYSLLRQIGSGTYYYLTDCNVQLILEK